MKKQLAACLAAFRFLTVLPIPGSLGTAAEDLPGATLYFPLVGLVIGAAAGACALLLTPIMPPLPTAVLLTMVLIAFSGALHLDGLADTADGFFSSRPRERMLEIMRDSRIGAMGVVALIMLLGLKISCLSSLNRIDLAKAVLLMPLAGRCAIPAMMALLPYARPAGGLGSLFYTRDARFKALASMIFLLIVAGLLGGLKGLVSVVLVALIVALFSCYCQKKIGGATGDTLGAVCELCETGFALGFCLTIWN